MYFFHFQLLVNLSRLGFHKGKLSYMDFLENFQDRRSFGWNERHVTEYPNRRYNVGGLLLNLFPAIIYGNTGFNICQVQPSSNTRRVNEGQ